MKLVKDIDNAFVSDMVNTAISYIGNILDSLEIRLGDEDYVLVDGRMAVVSISRNNQFVAENDKDGIGVLVMKRILSLRSPGPLSEILADREIIRLGLSDKLLYYYYALLYSQRRISSVEDFVQMNVPWLSFHPHDKNNAQLLKELAERLCMPEHRKEFEAATERLFALLQKNLYTEKAIMEAEEEWTSAIAKYRE